MIHNLEYLLKTWRSQLQAWSIDGSLRRSTMQALNLRSAPIELISLEKDLSQANFKLLPSIQIISSSDLEDEPGAYQSNTKCIFLNREWLQRSTTMEAMAVLEEGLGHHLDEILNPLDSPGDEGALFARLLEEPGMNSEVINTLGIQNDSKILTINGQNIAAEYAGTSTLAKNRSQTFRVSANELKGEASIEGILRHSVRLELTDTTYTTITGLYQKPSAFDGSASIILELAADAAPISVENFLSYTNSGFYRNTFFHRVIENFMIQGGGHAIESNQIVQKQTRPPIKLETTQISGLSNIRGTVAMARTNAPDTATSQFFVNSVNNSFLNSSSSTPGYAVFGAVSSGMDVVDAISKAVQTSTISTAVPEILEAFPNLTEPVVMISKAEQLARPTGLSFALEAPVLYGKLNLNATNGSFSYTPGTLRKDDAFTYWIKTPAWPGLAARSILREAIILVDEGPGKAAPISSSAPGRYEEGITLFGGGVSNDPDGEATITGYQWYRDGVAIPGETRSSTQTGFTGAGVYRVDVTYIDAQGFTSTVRSTPQLVKKVNNGSGNSDPITVIGAYQEGAILKAPGVSGDPDGFSKATSYQWYRNGQIVKGATRQTIQIASNSVALNRDYDSYEVEIRYIDGQGFQNTAKRSSPVNIFPQRTLTTDADRVTGRPLSDTFILPELNYSPITRFDRIVNFRSDDALDIPGSIRSTLTNAPSSVVVSSIQSLSSVSKTVANLLGSSEFAPGQATALIVMQGKRALGTAIALNDLTAGFDAQNDGVVFLENFIPSPTNPINLI